MAWMNDESIKELAAQVAAQGRSITLVCDKIAKNNYLFNGKQISLRKLTYEYYQLVDEPSVNLDEFLADC